MLVKDIIIRVHTLIVPEVGSGFNSTPPHRRMSRATRTFFAQMNHKRRGVKSTIKMSKLISGFSRLRDTKRRENAVRSDEAL
jgi:hypothetical protein